MSEDTLALLTRLTDYAEHSETAIAKVIRDVEQLREDRYRPYLASMGAFLALFVAAVGYIYAMEQRLTAGFFDVQSAIHELRSFERINEDRIHVLDTMLETRTSTMGHRWTVHMQQHEQQDKARALMAKELLSISREVRNTE